MALGLRVEPQALRGTGGKLHGLGDRAGGLLSKAAGVVVHPKSWGLVGMATLYSGYASALPPLHEHLHAVQTTLGAAGDKLDDSAKAYEEADKASGATLHHVGEELQHIPTTGGRPGPISCGPRPAPAPIEGHLGEARAPLPQQAPPWNPNSGPWVGEDGRLTDEDPNAGQRHGRVR